MVITILYIYLSGYVTSRPILRIVRAIRILGQKPVRLVQTYTGDINFPIYTGHGYSDFISRNRINQSK
jgi:hypothetical protein